jgi:hypothetical protein
VNASVWGGAAIDMNSDSPIFLPQEWKEKMDAPKGAKDIDQILAIVWPD